MERKRLLPPPMPPPFFFIWLVSFPFSSSLFLSFSYIIYFSCPPHVPVSYQHEVEIPRLSSLITLSFPSDQFLFLAPVLVITEPFPGQKTTS